MIVYHALARLTGLPGTAPVHALYIYLPRVVEILVKGVAVPVHGLGGRMTGLASHGLVDENALAVTCPAPLLPVCGLELLTATGTFKCARPLGVTVHCCNDCARVCLAIARLSVTTRSHTGPATGCLTIAGLVVASRDRGNSGSTVEPAPAVAGSSITSHVLFPGPRQAVPQPVGAHGAAGCSC